MTAVLVHPRLVRVERWLMPDLYAVPGRGPRWVSDVTGRAVDPFVQHAITAAITASGVSLSTPQSTSEAHG